MDRLPTLAETANILGVSTRTARRIVAIVTTQRHGRLSDVFVEEEVRRMEGRNETKDGTGASLEGLRKSL
jgi:hypothetical protein